MNLQTVLLYVSLAVGSMFFYDRWMAPSDVSGLLPIQEASVLPHTPSHAQLIYVTTPEVRFAIDHRTSQIVSAQLLSFYEDQTNQKPVDLLSSDPTHPFLVHMGVEQDQVAAWSVRHWGEHGGVLVAYLPNGAVLEKHFSRGPQPYTLEIRTRITNPGQHIIHTRFNMEYLAQSYTPMPTSLPKPDQFIAGSDQGASSSWFSFNTFAGISYHDSEHSYKKIPYSSLVKAPMHSTVQSPWLAVQRRYFVTALIPSFDRSYNLVADWRQGKGSDQHLDQRLRAGFTSTELSLGPNESSEQTAVLFAGPEDRNLLKQVAPKLDLTIDFGMFWILCDALLWSLELLHSVLGDWGLSIVVLTFFIRGLFYRSSARGFRSMQRIKQLAPEVQRIQTQYANNDAEKNKAIMELYKKEQVNPFSGCLPALMPLPFMMALYYVLLEAIQLRHISFLWLPDLSSPDPYFILPVLLGISMLIQQALTPVDASQKAMMFSMPLVIAYMATQFSSGLALFYFVNTVLGALQQWWLVTHHRV